MNDGRRQGQARHAVIGRRTVALVLCLVVFTGRPWRALGAEPPPPNLLPNPSFELVEPPMPSAESAVSGAPASPGLYLPRTWNVHTQGAMAWQCPDDAVQAYTGSRCAHFKGENGLGTLRYGPIPVPNDATWHVRFQARGTGTIVGGAYDVLPREWRRLPNAWPFSLGPDWQVFEFDLKLPEECRQWLLDLATQGAVQAWIDDILVTCPGMVDLDLPPREALTRDDHTLLYLPFEDAFNEDVFFVKPGTTLSAPDAGRFGRSLVLGPGGYVACSANENLDPAVGTIEVWVKFLSPGNDGVYRPIVGVPGPDGMMLSKDQYSHMHVGFSRGWSPLGQATAQGYAHAWQPGVWRHVAACWDRDLLQLFVDGKLIAWTVEPDLPRSLGPELGIGGPGMELDDLRISNVVRYRLPVPLP